MAVIRRMMDGCPVTVVTTIDGLSDRLLPLEELQKNRCVFKVGDILPLEALSRKLTALGFERVSQVEGPGQFAVRGGILDIYNLADECLIVSNCGEMKSIPSEVLMQRVSGLLNRLMR